MLTALIRGRAALAVERWQGRAILAVGLHGFAALLHRAHNVAVEAVAVLAGLYRIDELAVLVTLGVVVALRGRSVRCERRRHDQTGCRR